MPVVPKQRESAASYVNSAAPLTAANGWFELRQERRRETGSGSSMRNWNGESQRRCFNGKKDRSEDIQQSIWLGPAAAAVDSARSGLTARFYYAERDCHGINVWSVRAWIFLRFEGNMERLLTRRALGKAWKYRWRYGGMSMKLRRSIWNKKPDSGQPQLNTSSLLHVIVWMQTGRRINGTVAVLRPVAGSEPWSGSVLRFGVCVCVCVCGGWEI